MINNFYIIDNYDIVNICINICNIDIYFNNIGLILTSIYILYFMEIMLCIPFHINGYIPFVLNI